MIGIIKKNTTGKKVLLFFVVSNIIYLLMLLVTIPKLMKYTGGMKILDMMPLGYDPDYVKTLFQQLGEDGRNFYLYYQIPLDLIYPFLFATSISLMLYWFFEKLVIPNSKIFYASLIPVFAASFDYLENFGIIAMLSIYPDFSFLLAQITSVFSLLKSSLVSVSFTILIITIIIFLVQKIRRWKM